MNTCTVVQGYVTAIGKEKKHRDKKYVDIEVTTSGSFLDGKMIGRPHTHRVRFGEDKLEDLEQINLGSMVRLDCYSNPVRATFRGEDMLFEYLRFKRFKEVLEEVTA